MRQGAWRDLPGLDERERLALELAERGTATPPEVDDAFFARLAARFSPPEIVELSAIIAWENYRARFNVILGIEGHGFYLPE
ncbi:MAG TPA: hypothetical protein VFI42_13950 [Thermomicrobiaceae bacterium]|nr:hypothetical protein [Thermomicrobiaceae bacterium]